MKSWKKAVIVGVVLLLLLGRTSHEVKFDYEIEAPAFRVAEAFADIPRYPEWADGQVERGAIDEEEAYLNENSDVTREVKYSVWAAGRKHSGWRKYTFVTAQPHIKVEQRIFTWLGLEYAKTNWVFAGTGGFTQIRQRGTHSTPWYLSSFVEFHNEQVQVMFENIKRELEATTEEEPTPETAIDEGEETETI